MDVMGLTNERVLEQLARIVSSEDFQASERLKDFLTFVVEETLAGRGESIKAYSIALAVFGRGVDFDPMLDPIVRVEAGRLRKLLERYYFLHPSDPVLIKIPRGNYIPLFNFRAGAEQAAPDNGQEEPGVKNELEVILGKQLRIDDTELRQEKRPVLLFIPFSNLTGDPAMSPLILGLAEDLLLRLNPNKLVDLRVASAGRGVDGECINSCDAVFPLQAVKRGSFYTATSRPGTACCGCTFHLPTPETTGGSGRKNSTYLTPRGIFWKPRRLSAPKSSAPWWTASASSPGCSCRKSAIWT